MFLANWQSYRDFGESYKDFMFQHFEVGRKQSNAWMNKTCDVLNALESTQNKEILQHDKVVWWESFKQKQF